MRLGVFTRLCRRCLLVLPLYAVLLSGVPAQARHVRQAPQIDLVVTAPGNPVVRYGVDGIEQVVRSTDSGGSWTPVFNPGDAQAPDPSSPGACLPGNFARVTFLALDPAPPHGLYVGTEGMLGDYLDNGCGNAPGGLFFSANGLTGFVPRNAGLPAGADARGGGVAWGVRSLTFDPARPGAMYVQTDPVFLTIPAGSRTANPTAPGIYRTLDGGVQWDAAFTGIGTTPCQLGACRYPGSLAIVPGQSRTLLFAAATGLYRSDDQGAHWVVHGVPAARDPASILLRVDPYQPSLVYVVSDQAIYRSVDQGLHIALVPRPPVPPASVLDVRFGSGTPATVLFVLRDGRQIRVTDSGANTAPVPTAPPAASPTMPPSPTSTVMPGNRTSPPRVSPTPVARTPSVTPSPRSVPATPSPVPGAATAAGSWPMVGHDPGQSFADPAGVSLAAAAHMRPRWQHPGVVPAIEADGRLYALGSGGTVTALAPASGAVLHRYLSTGVVSLAYSQGLLYFNRGSEIRIVDAATAAWRHTATAGQGKPIAAFSQIVVADRAIYTAVGGPSSYLPRYFAFDRLTGRMLWSHPGNASSIPCLAGSTLYLSLGAGGSGDSYLLDPATGAVRGMLTHFGNAQWHSSGSRLYASVLKGAGSALTAFVDAFSLDGQLRWVAHDVLFGAALPGTLFAVTPGALDARSALDGHRLWKTAIPGLQSVAQGSVAVAGTLLYAQAPDGRISVLDAHNGRLLRVLTPPGPSANAGNLIVADGMVFESVNGKRAGGGLGPFQLLAFGP